MRLHTKGIAGVAVLFAAIIATPTGAGDIGTPCPADVNGDLMVDVQDLVQVILDWGCEGRVKCIGDANGNGTVDVKDLVDVILSWGACPR